MSSIRGALSRKLEQMSVWATEWSGRSEIILAAVVVVAIWMASGPWLHYSDAWQLAINSVTSVVTFLMVFLIQRAQNKSAMAVQLKLNEIIGALRGASNRMIGIEELSEDDLRRLHERYQQLAEISQDTARLKAAVSVDGVDQHPPDTPRSNDAASRPTPRRTPSTP